VTVYTYPPLRREDIQALREFRNAQIDVLRQAEPLSEQEQERWYEHQVLPAHSDPRPSQVLVSILDPGGGFVGYGGLTNVRWDHRRAEVSFLVDPNRAADKDVYRRDMTAFLDHLAGLAFGEHGLNRLFAETWAFREFHISVLEEAGFVYEGRLREHTLDAEGRPIDSVLHSRLASEWEA
jgi:RimJ/RimL family protein N-acetyltransferase